jgi:hypothetical protein
MGSPNGGIIGIINPTSFGKDTVTSVTSSTPLTTQPGTRLVQTLVVAGGGGGGGACSDSSIGGAGGGGGGFRTGCLQVCGATAYPITVGAGGAGGAAGSGSGASNAVIGNPSIFLTITSAGGGKGAGRVSPDIPTANAFDGGSGGGMVW